MPQPYHRGQHQSQGDTAPCCYWSVLVDGVERFTAVDEAARATLEEHARRTYPNAVIETARRGN